VTVIVSGTVSKPGSLTASAEVWAAGEVNRSDNTATLVQAVADPNAPNPTPAPTPKQSSASGSGGAPPPTVSGAANVGVLLEAALPASLRATPDVRYQWQALVPVKQVAALGGGRNRLQWVDIKGANAASFKAPARVLGRKLRVQVTAGKRSFVSAPTAPVKSAHRR